MRVCLHPPQESFQITKVFSLFFSVIIIFRKVLSIVKIRWFCNVVKIYIYDSSIKNFITPLKHFQFLMMATFFHNNWNLYTKSDFSHHRVGSYGFPKQMTSQPVCCGDKQSWAQVTSSEIEQNFFFSYLTHEQKCLILFTSLEYYNFFLDLFFNNIKNPSLTYIVSWFPNRV